VEISNIYINGVKVGKVKITPEEFGYIVLAVMVTVWYFKE